MSAWITRDVISADSVLAPKLGASQALAQRLPRPVLRGDVRRRLTQSPGGPGGEQSGAELNQAFGRDQHRAVGRMT